MERAYLISLAVHALLVTLLWQLAGDQRSVRSDPSGKVTTRLIRVRPPSIGPADRPGASQVEPPYDTPPQRTPPQRIPPQRIPPPSKTPPAARAASLEKDTAPRPGAASPPISRPQLIISEPSYPTRINPERAMLNNGSGPNEQAGGLDQRNRQAVPYYHPAVSLEGVVHKEWILVKFTIEANGRFEPEILDGTGDIHRDARVLQSLRKWRWLPMRIDGQDLPSVEVVRLFKRELGGLSGSSPQETGTAR